jgi:hypothetical protein
MESNGRGFAAVHPVYSMAKKVTPRLKKAPPKRNFIRQWRKKKDNMSLEKLAERMEHAHGISITHASLSRIERGIQPYSQPILEAIAAELTGGDVASLLIRDPSDPEGIWSIWDNAKPGERSMIIDLAKTVVKKTGT